jgi:hypothetical protein
MPYANTAKQKSYQTKYRQKRQASSKIRQTESTRKKAWYLANQKRERAKRSARNIQDRHLVGQPVEVALPDQRASAGHIIKTIPWEKLTPAQTLQCFHRDARGILQYRSPKQQLQWLKNRAPIHEKQYSVIRDKVWFNRDAVLTITELKELARRL